MTVTKRLFDIVLALALGAVLLIPTLLLALWVLVEDGRPIFYLSDRMRSPDKSFRLWKFRTMRMVPGDLGVSGGDKQHRITSSGRLLRRLRLDEIPQLWNILKGDMSFVGPRPPLRRYTDMFPDIYDQVLKSRPGLTGMATLHFRLTEERLLSRCKTPKETESVYTRRCVPRKARLDLIYQERSSVCLDAKILFLTITQVLGGRR